MKPLAPSPHHSLSWLAIDIHAARSQQCHAHVVVAHATSRMMPLPAHAARSQLAIPSSCGAQPARDTRRPVLPRLAVAFGPDGRGYPRVDGLCTGALADVDRGDRRRTGNDHDTVDLDKQQRRGQGRSRSGVCRLLFAARSQAYLPAASSQQDAASSQRMRLAASGCGFQPADAASSKHCSVQLPGTAHKPRCGFSQQDAASSQQMQRPASIPADAARSQQHSPCDPFLSG